MYMDELVLVKKRRRDKFTGRWMTDGQWLAKVQQAAQRDALEVWGQRPVEPFKVIPPVPHKVWSRPALHVLWSCIRP